MRTNNNNPRIPGLLCCCNNMLFSTVSAAILLLLSQSVNLASVKAFNPAADTIIRRGKTILRADTIAPPVDAVNGASAVAASSSPSAEPAAPSQAEYGESLEYPTTYASCGKCGASFALTPEAMGGGPAGRRMECSICDHTWFQSKSRLATLNGGYEMVPLPERDLDRIALNIKEGKNPKFMGEVKVYVGNISFLCTEEDLYEAFSEYGPVGDVSLVRDDVGKIRGFGFVTMRNKEDGEQCLEQLDGAELKGRKINVRPTNN